MAARFGDDDDDIIADINVTPLVDITLVLLIIFMVTATYIISPSIQVNLPKAATGSETAPSPLSVTLNRTGELFLNGERITEQALPERIRKAVADQKDVQAIIGADREVSHGAVVHLIDLVKSQGVIRFAINIDPEVRSMSVQDGEPPSESP